MFQDPRTPRASPATSVLSPIETTVACLQFHLARISISSKLTCWGTTLGENHVAQRCGAMLVAGSVAPCIVAERSYRNANRELVPIRPGPIFFCTSLHCVGRVFYTVEKCPKPPRRWPVVTGTNIGAAEVQRLVGKHFTMHVVESLDLVMDLKTILCYVL